MDEAIQNSSTSWSNAIWRVPDLVVGAEDSWCGMSKELLDAYSREGGLVLQLICSDTSISVFVAIGSK
jgi:hypothetical protein